MTLGNFIGMNILSIVGFTLIYFISKEILRVTKERINVFSWILSFVIGITLLVIQLLLVIETQNHILLSISLIEFMLFGTRLDQKFLIGMFPFLFIAIALNIFNSASPPDFIWEAKELARLIPILSILSIGLIFFYSNLFKNNSTKTFVSITVLISATLIEQIILNTKQFTNGKDILEIVMGSLSVIIFTFVFWFMQIIFMHYIDVFFKKFTSLEDSSTIDSRGFIRIAKVDGTFNYLIDKNRISIGFFYIIRFENHELVNINKKDFSLFEDPIIFEPSSKILGIFVRYRNHNSNLNDEIIKNNTKLINSLASISNFKASLCIYGVDSSNFSELVKYGINSLPIKYDNKINKFNINLQKEQAIKKTKSALLFEYIDNAKIEHIASTTTKNNVYFTEYFTKENENLKNKISKLSNDERSLIYRNLAFTSLEELSKDLMIRYDEVMINYSMYSFNDNFDINKFEKKAREFTNKTIILGIKSIDFNDDKKSLEILEKLRNKNIKICADAIEDWQLGKLKILNPEYVKSKNIRTIKRRHINIKELFDKITLELPNLVELS